MITESDITLPEDTALRTSSDEIREFVQQMPFEAEIYENREGAQIDIQPTVPMGAKRRREIVEAVRPRLPAGTAIEVLTHNHSYDIIRETEADGYKVVVTDGAHQLFVGGYNATHEYAGSPIDSHMLESIKMRVRAGDLPPSIECERDYLTDEEFMRVVTALPDGMSANDVHPDQLAAFIEQDRIEGLITKHGGFERLMEKAANSAERSYQNHVQTSGHETVSESPDDPIEGLKQQYVNDEIALHEFEERVYDEIDVADPVTTPVL